MLRKRFSFLKIYCKICLYLFVISLNTDAYVQSFLLVNVLQLYIDKQILIQIYELNKMYEWKVWQASHKVCYKTRDSNEKADNYHY